MANQRCKRCSIEKDASFTYYRLGHNGKLKRVCRDCETAWAIAWNKENKDRIRNKELLNKYGISLEDFQILKDTQVGKCAICKQSDVILCVDHNHATGKVRGLLCHCCNLAIGNFKEETNRLVSAISYLERYK